MHTVGCLPTVYIQEYTYFIYTKNHDLLLTSTETKQF